MTDQSSNQPATQPEKFDLRSHDIADDKQQALLRLFPEIRTEGGKIDFDRLKLALGAAVDVGKERYGMNWPGKAECFKTIQSPSMGTLRPCVDESINFDTTENMIIEGDNLEVLKLLQKSYLGKIKMIYIDPPYNTGNDFIYPDNYSESLQTYLEYTGQADAEGRKFGTNTDTDGRFHSKWLNMMYPRLYLARNLLREDGAIFITIDDSEVDNLRKLCSEIFGEENFIAQIEWQKRYTRSNNTDEFTSVIDHIVVFAKSDRFRPQLMERDEDADARYANPDNDNRGPWKAIPFLNPLSPEERPNLAYEITHPSGRKIRPSRKAWRSEESVWKRLVAENRVWWGKSGESEIPNVKRFLSEVRQGMTPINFWSYEFAGHTDSANQELKDLLGEKVFDTPKPSLLIQRMIQLVAAKEDDAIVLDFFAGSGTAAQSTLELNKQDGGGRRFVLVQLPELTERTDYPTIADITKERVRRVIKKLNDEDAGKLDLDDVKKQDRGFRVFKLSESNFKPWNATVTPDEQALTQQLELHVDHVREGRMADDILYEILLKSGFALTTKVEVLEFASSSSGNVGWVPHPASDASKSAGCGTQPTGDYAGAGATMKVYSVANGALFICLERQLTLELIRAMADKQPERVVCLDEGFAGNDQLKANAVQIFKTKGVTSFKTV